LLPLLPPLLINQSNELTISFKELNNYLDCLIRLTLKRTALHVSLTLFKSSQFFIKEAFVPICIKV